MEPLSPTQDGTSGGDDQSFLDDVLDRALTQIEEGLPIDMEELVAQRADLRPQVEAVVEHARHIAVNPVLRFPEVAGYTILGELGAGGMGNVYLARQDRVGRRTVALKVLPRASALSASARSRFLSEARAIARMRHAHVVIIHDVIHSGDLFAYAMERVDGASLAQLIEYLHGLGRAPTTADVRRRLDAPDDGGHVEWPATYVEFVARVGLGMARALSAVHATGLLHRDVKPSNILLRRDGTPLLSDFGLVRDTVVSLHTQQGAFLGTIPYAAPEQLRGETEALDERTDIYSLGVTLYYALALRLPFSTAQRAGVLRSIEEGLAAPLRRINRGVPADLQTIVAKAMEAQPARRYASANDLADDLERFLSHRPIRARRAGTVTRAAKFLRRNRRTVGAATLGGVLATIFAVVLGLYLFWLPKWIDGQVMAARALLLNPTHRELVYMDIHNLREPGGSGHWRNQVATAVQNYGNAVLLYDKAMFAVRIRDRSGPLVLEREAVALAREVLQADRRNEGATE